MVHKITLLVFLMAGCVTPDAGPPPLTLDQTTKLVPSRVADRAGWAADINSAIEALDLVPTAERVCAVLAVIEQESNYAPNPTVHNLPKIVREGLLKKLEPLGLMKRPALAVLLAGHAPGQKESFNSRIDKLRTEKDLDLFFRDMAEAYRNKFPGSFVIASALFKIFGDKGLYDLNPVTTAGSMQVKIDYAHDLEDFKKLNDGEVRDVLYTRAGGIRAGTARLLGYKANYDNVMYRFADYNSGMYSSRNAAFQKLLADLTGQQLVLDGDLLAYEVDGDRTGGETQSLKAMVLFAKMHDMWEWRVRRAARQEKEYEFEETAIWEEVRETWQETKKTEPPYAQIPNVVLASPKLSGTRTTQWFANNVTRRYNDCRKR